MVRGNGVDNSAERPWSVSGAAISGVGVLLEALVLSEPVSPWSNEALHDDGDVTGSQYAEGESGD